MSILEHRAVRFGSRLTAPFARHCAILSLLFIADSALS
jgi:hypothetical protein